MYTEQDESMLCTHMYTRLCCDLNGLVVNAFLTASGETWRLSRSRLLLFVLAVERSSSVFSDDAEEQISSSIFGINNHLLIIPSFSFCNMW